MDGTIVLDLAGPLPPGTEPPGLVRYFDARGSKAGVDKLPAIVVPGAVPATPADHSLCISGEGGSRVCTLGDNLYAKARVTGGGRAPDPCSPARHSRPPSPAPLSGAQGQALRPADRPVARWPGRRWRRRRSARARARVIRRRRPV